MNKNNWWQVWVNGKHVYTIPYLGEVTEAQVFEDAADGDGDYDYNPKTDTLAVTRDPNK